MNHTPIDSFIHAGYKISDYGHGLRPFDNRFGFVIGYVARRRNIVLGFAFAIDGLQLVARHTHHVTIDHIVEAARNAIRHKLDEGPLEPWEEYTFEYDFDDPATPFKETWDPDWWIKNPRPVPKAADF